MTKIYLKFRFYVYFRYDKSLNVKNQQELIGCHFNDDEELIGKIVVNVVY